MKNGTTKSEIKRGISKARPRFSLKIPKDDLPKIVILAVTGIVLSLSIQKSIAVEQLLGGFLIVGVLLFILYRDIMRYKPAYIKNYNTLLLLCFMLVFILLIARFYDFLFSSVSKGSEFIPVEGAIYGMPIPAGAMLVALLFDFHTAIIFSFTVSILTGIWLHNAAFTVYVFVGSLIAAFSVIRCKKRSALLWGGLYVLAANVFTVIIISLFEGRLFTTEALSSIAFAIFAGINVLALVSMLLPLLEYVFNVSTDISLIELLDLNQPVIRNLMVSAPGTYHHSVIVGNLAESAAEMVGVNPLLARVSAYYHDIGKLKMPEYFVENQRTPISKHDRLTPHMSSIIILNHVKEGVEIARQLKLPQPIIDIILQHHGTSLLTFFYKKAKDQWTESLPSEEDYRYPGPKPQTRVAALVMMADEVEAASRVLSEPTPAKITALVDRVINHMFLDRQLDECELTLKDIYEIKKNFAYVLSGIFHKRIDYPGLDFTSESIYGVYKEPAKVNKGKPAETKKASEEGAPSPRAPQS